MYNILLRGTAGPEHDIAKARIYVDGQQVAEVDVTSGVQFTATLTHPGDATIAIGYTFVDASNNESGAFVQSLVVPSPPDVTAPASPAGPMTIVSVVWVP